MAFPITPLLVLITLIPIASGGRAKSIEISQFGGLLQPCSFTQHTERGGTTADGSVNDSDGAAGWMQPVNSPSFTGYCY